MSKESHELKIFKDFVKSSRLPVDPDSIKSLQPPKPDILCLIDGQKHYFELTRAADQEIANDIGELTSGRSNRNVGEMLCYDDNKILEDAIKKKAAKHYETNDCPINLLVYIDGKFHYCECDDFDKLKPTLEYLQTKYSQKWRQIWAYDFVSKKLLY